MKRMILKKCRKCQTNQMVIEDKDQEGLITSNQIPCRSCGAIDFDEFHASQWY